MVESEICLRENGSALLVHPDYDGRVTADWFRPDYWAGQARPVSSGAVVVPGLSTPMAASWCCGSIAVAA